MTRATSVPDIPTPDTAPPAPESIAEALGLPQLLGATLAEVDAAAALQHRVDRKYLVPLDVATQLVASLAGTHRVLDIAGRRTTDYRSTYFDTPELAAWRAHVQGRRHRWKIRTRLYAEDGLCRIEVKTKDGRGATVKHARSAEADAYGQLDRAATDFVDTVLRQAGITTVPITDLTPVGEIRYHRAALADLEGGTRVTLDALLTCRRDDQSTALDPGHVLVETKGGLRAAPADRLLLDLGARPVSISKYVIGLSLLVPGLPGNDFRRIARSYFRNCTPSHALERNTAA